MTRAVYLAVIVATVAVVAGCGGSKSTPSTTSTSKTTPSTTTTGGGGAAAGSTVKIAADESGALQFAEKTIEAKAGKITIDFSNPSQVSHDVKIESGEKELGGTKTIAAGSDTTTVNLKPGKYKFYCSVDGHEQAGMVGTLTVK